MNTAGVVAGAARAVRLPIHLLHELTHIAAALPWATDWRLVVGPRDSDAPMDVFVEFDEDAPRVGVALTHLAPFLAGLLGALAAVAALELGLVGTPSTPRELLVYSALAMAWALYSLPSAQDRHGAREALRGEAPGDADDDG